MIAVAVVAVDVVVAAVAVVAVVVSSNQIRKRRRWFTQTGIYVWPLYKQIIRMVSPKLEMAQEATHGDDESPKRVLPCRVINHSSAWYRRS